MGRPPSLGPTENADVVLDHVRRLHSGPWGRVLDAGTGQSSLEWVVSLECAAWTAVTAEPARADGLRERTPLRPQDRLLVGNWADPGLLAGEQFEVVLADYLLGAVDRFAPWFQLELLRRLAGLTAGVLYLVGLEPYPEPSTPQERLITDIANLREAVHHLLGRRPHREVPCSWAAARLVELGLEVSEPVLFQNHYGEEFLEGELGSLESLAPAELRPRVQRLRAHGRRLLRQGPLTCGHDYLLLGRKMRSAPATPTSS